MDGTGSHQLDIEPGDQDGKILNELTASHHPESPSPSIENPLPTQRQCQQHQSSSNNIPLTVTDRTNPPKFITPIDIDSNGIPNNKPSKTTTLIPSTPNTSSLLLPISPTTTTATKRARSVSNGSDSQTQTRMIESHAESPTPNSLLHPSGMTTTTSMANGDSIPHAHWVREGDLATNTSRDSSSISGGVGGGGDDIVREGARPQDQGGATTTTTESTYPRRKRRRTSASTSISTVFSSISSEGGSGSSRASEGADHQIGEVETKKKKKRGREDEDEGGRKMSNEERNEDDNGSRLAEPTMNARSPDLNNDSHDPEAINPDSFTRSGADSYGNGGTPIEDVTLVEELRTSKRRRLDEEEQGDDDPGVGHEDGGNDDIDTVENGDMEMEEEEKKSSGKMELFDALMAEPCVSYSYRPSSMCSSRRPLRTPPLTLSTLPPEILHQIFLSLSIDLPYPLSSQSLISCSHTCALFRKTIFNYGWKLFSGDGLDGKLGGKGLGKRMAGFNLMERKRMMMLLDEEDEDEIKEDEEEDIYNYHRVDQKKEGKDSKKNWGAGGPMVMELSFEPDERWLRYVKGLPPTDRELWDDIPVRNSNVGASTSRVLLDNNNNNNTIFSSTSNQQQTTHHRQEGPPLAPFTLMQKAYEHARFRLSLTRGRLKELRFLGSGEWDSRHGKGWYPVAAEVSDPSVPGPGAEQGNSSSSGRNRDPRTIAPPLPPSESVALLRYLDLVSSLDGGHSLRHLSASFSAPSPYYRRLLPVGPQPIPGTGGGRGGPGGLGGGGDGGPVDGRMEGRVQETEEDKLGAVNGYLNWARNLRPREDVEKVSGWLDDGSRNHQPDHGMDYEWDHDPSGGAKKRIFSPYDIGGPLYNPRSLDPYGTHQDRSATSVRPKSSSGLQSLKLKTPVLNAPLAFSLGGLIAGSGLKNLKKLEIEAIGQRHRNSGGGRGGGAGDGAGAGGGGGPGDAAVELMMQHLQNAMNGALGGAGGGGGLPGAPPVGQGVGVGGGGEQPLGLGGGAGEMGAGGDHGLLGQGHLNVGMGGAGVAAGAGADVGEGDHGGGHNPPPNIQWADADGQENWDDFMMGDGNDDGAGDDMMEMDLMQGIEDDVVDVVQMFQAIQEQAQDQDQDPHQQQGQEADIHHEQDQEPEQGPQQDQEQEQEPEQAPQDNHDEDHVAEGGEETDRPEREVNRNENNPTDEEAMAVDPDHGDEADPDVAAEPDPSQTNQELPAQQLQQHQQHDTLRQEPPHEENAGPEQRPPLALTLPPLQPADVQQPPAPDGLQAPPAPVPPPQPDEPLWGGLDILRQRLRNADQPIQVRRREGPRVAPDVQALIQQHQQQRHQRQQQLQELQAQAQAQAQAQVQAQVQAQGQQGQQQGPPVQPQPQGQPQIHAQPQAQAQHFQFQVPQQGGMGIQIGIGLGFAAPGGLHVPVAVHIPIPQNHATANSSAHLLPFQAPPPPLGFSDTTACPFRSSGPNSGFIHHALEELVLVGCTLVASASLLSSSLPYMPNLTSLTLRDVYLPAHAQGFPGTRIRMNSVGEDGPALNRNLIPLNFLLSQTPNLISLELRSVSSSEAISPMPSSYPDARLLRRVEYASPVRLPALRTLAIKGWVPNLFTPLKVFPRGAQGNDNLQRAEDREIHHSDFEIDAPMLERVSFLSATTSGFSNISGPRADQQPSLQPRQLRNLLSKSKNLEQIDFKGDITGETFFEGLRTSPSFFEPFAMGYQALRSIYGDSLPQMTRDEVFHTPQPRTMRQLKFSVPPPPPRPAITVRKLTFYDCPYLDDAVILSLAHLTPSLRELSIRKCVNVTMSAVALMAARLARSENGRRLEKLTLDYMELTSWSRPGGQASVQGLIRWCVRILKRARAEELVEMVEIVCHQNESMKKGLFKELGIGSGLDVESFIGFMHSLDLRPKGSLWSLTSLRETNVKRRHRSRIPDSLWVPLSTENFRNVQDGELEFELSRQLNQAGLGNPRSRNYHTPGGPSSITVEDPGSATIPYSFAPFLPRVWPPAPMLPFPASFLYKQVSLTNPPTSRPTASVPSPLRPGHVPLSDTIHTFNRWLAHYHERTSFDWLSWIGVDSCIVNYPPNTKEEIDWKTKVPKKDGEGTVEDVVYVIERPEVKMHWEKWFSYTG